MRLLILLSAVLGLAAAADADPARDGMPKTGVNFLMPFDASRYDPAKAGGTLRANYYTPSRLNPVLGNEAVVSDLYRLINRPLCYQPAWAPERYMSEVAESVVISDDWKTFTFTLRPGLVWQRPLLAKQPEFAWLDRDQPLTSRDFAFAIETILDPQVDAPVLRGYYEDVAGVETPDDLTLVIRWKRALYSAITASLELEPLPRHIYGRQRDGSELPRDRFGPAFNEHWFDALGKPVGVGEFAIEEFTPDQIIRFRQVPGAWGRTNHADAIEWRLDLKKDEAQLVAFKNGQIHADGLSPLQYRAEILDRKEPRFAAPDAQDPKAGRAGPFGWEKVKTRQYGYIGWNMRRPIFADRRTRQALTHAMPKARIIREVMAGLGQPVLAGVIYDSDAYNRDLKPYAFDLKRSRELLAEAGWRDSDGDGLLDRTIDGRKTPFAFTLTYFANAPEWDTALAIYRNELRKLGIDLRLKTLEWKEMVRVYEDRDFDAVLGAWRMSFELAFHQLWHSSQADVPSGSNHCGFRNARVDELSDRLRTTFPIAERLAIAKEIQAIIHEEQPYTFLWQTEGVFVWQNRPEDGAARQPGRYLANVANALDTLHPLYATRHLNGVWQILP